jgi:hypothetical protein
LKSKCSKKKKEHDLSKFCKTSLISATRMAIHGSLVHRNGENGVLSTGMTCFSLDPSGRTVSSTVWAKTRGIKSLVDTLAPSPAAHSWEEEGKEREKKKRYYVSNK